MGTRNDHGQKLRPIHFRQNRSYAKEFIELSNDTSIEYTLPNETANFIIGHREAYSGASRSAIRSGFTRSLSFNYVEEREIAGSGSDLTILRIKKTLMETSSRSD